MTSEPSDLWLWSFACVWFMTLTCLGLKVKLKGQNAVKCDLESWDWVKTILVCTYTCRFPCEPAWVSRTTLEKKLPLIGVGPTHDLDLQSPASYMVPKVQGQWSVGNKDRVETDGRTEATVLPPSLIRLVIRTKITQLENAEIATRNNCPRPRSDQPH